jgi:hypothetical protein
MSVPCVTAMTVPMFVQNAILLSVPLTWFVIMIKCIVAPVPKKTNGNVELSFMFIKTNRSIDHYKSLIHSSCRRRRRLRPVNNLQLKMRPLHKKTNGS